MRPNTYHAFNSAGRLTGEAFPLYPDHLDCGWIIILRHPQPHPDNHEVFPTLDDLRSHLARTSPALELVKVS